jgi:hypothetical protein
MTVDELIVELQALSKEGHGNVAIALHICGEPDLSYQDISLELITNARVTFYIDSPPIRMDVVLIS